MILVKPSFEIMEIMRGWQNLEEDEYGALQLIEEAGRTCYKSEYKIINDSSKEFIRKIIKRGHESVIEHSAMTVRIICDRGVTHETVRHRLCAFSQESTRYVNYAKDDEISVIAPFFFDPLEEVKPIEIPIEYHRKSSESAWSFSTYNEILMNSFDVWFLTCLWTQWGYMTLVKEFKKSPQQARSVLPNSTKTEIVITANFREWRHIFKLRCSPAAHPQMREIMIPLLKKIREYVPIIFDDIIYFNTGD